MKKSHQLVEILIVAALYVVTARIGQAFAIAPGNVTSVWIPSGLMIALTLYRGTHIWPGVFLGAFIGNSWAYLDPATLTGILAAFSAATLNGIGDVLCCVVMANLVQRQTQSSYPFTKVVDFSWYLFLAVIAGPLLSAIFGVSGLYLFHFIEPAKYFELFQIWFVGDAAGALIFGPLVLSWLVKDSYHYKNQLAVIFALGLYSVAVTGNIFGLLTAGPELVTLGILVLPVALFAMLYYGQRTVFTVQMLITAVAVYATSQGKGPFFELDSSQALLHLQSFIAIFSLNMFALAIFIHDKQKSSRLLALKKKELESLYRQDQLTGSWNRYRIREFIEFEINRYARSQRSFGLIVLDIDGFKQINDQYGHLEGDKVLIELCQLIRTHIREADLFGRWGGEEFIIVVTETDQASILHFAEKIRELVDKCDFGLETLVTVSLGVTLVQPDDNLLKMIDRADEAMYRSKRRGKNAVTFYQPQKALEEAVG